MRQQLGSAGRRARAVGRAVGLVLWPRRCLVCRAPLGVACAAGMCAICSELLPDHAGPLCPRCGLESAEPGACLACCAAPPPWRALHAPYAYAGAVRGLIGRCKFQRRDDLGAALGALFAAQPAVRELAAGAQGVVPVPMPGWRRRRRGFNLATLLARPLAAACGLPLVSLLVRQRSGPPQSGLPGAARRANVQGAFAARRPMSGCWLLVDDIVTSGHTAAAASRALLAAGAQEVRVSALARTGHISMRGEGKLG